MKDVERMLSLNFEDVLSWARDKERENPDQTVGWICNSFRCPLARFLREAKPFGISDWSVNYSRYQEAQNAYAQGTKPGERLSWLLPRWTFAFLELADDSIPVLQQGHQFPRPVITAAMCVTLLLLSKPKE